MSKPEPPKKIDPLPAPKAADPKPPVAKKTGWEPPSPQKQRVSERKLGMLLAVCLLVALGYVSYRKFNSNRLPAIPGNPTAQFGKLPPEPGQNPPPADLGNHAEKHLVADPASGQDTADAAFFGSATPPEQGEPVADAATFQSGSTPTFDLGPSEPPPQAEPEPPAADESSNPFFAAAGAPDEATSDAEVESGDPFASNGLVATETDITTFSSDSANDFGAPPDGSAMPPANELTFSDPPSQSEPEPADAPSAPVVGLFAVEPVDEPANELSPEPQDDPSSPVASPWGTGTSDPGETTDLVESEPALIEPNDPQVMPALTLGPFDGAAADSATPSDPPVREPVESGSGFNPYPAATVETPVRQRVPPATPTEDPFAARGNTTVVERSTNSLEDPFVPARDVQHAIREDEVIVHEVQSGDNFWNIAKQHYGSGRYFTALAAYNQTLIPDPRRIRPGMRVQVPSELVLAQQFPRLVSGGTNAPYAAPPAGPPGFSLDAQGHPCYRVSRGDTLSDIARKHLGRASRWRQIFGMNIDQLTSADSLTTGMVLRLPADATQIRMDAAGIGSR